MVCGRPVPDLLLFGVVNRHATSAVERARGRGVVPGQGRGGTPVGAFDDHSIVGKIATVLKVLDTWRGVWVGKVSKIARSTPGQ